MGSAESIEEILHNLSRYWLDLAKACTKDLANVWTKNQDIEFLNLFSAQLVVACEHSFELKQISGQQFEAVKQTQQRLASLLNHVEASKKWLANVRTQIQELISRTSTTASSRRGFLRGAMTRGTGLAVTLGAPSLARGQERSINVKRVFRNFNALVDMNYPILDEKRRKSGLFLGPFEQYKGEEFPTVILIEDEHYGTDNSTGEGWKTEQEQIELLYANNVTTIGIEGWAGEKADKKRGYQFLNAERLLIQWLFTQRSRFTVIALEDPTLQQNGLFSTIVLIVRKFDASTNPTKWDEVGQKLLARGWNEIHSLYQRFGEALVSNAQELTSSNPNHLFRNFIHINELFKELKKLLNKYTRENKEEQKKFLEVLEKYFTEVEFLVRDLNYLIEYFTPLISGRKLTFTDYLNARQSLLYRARRNTRSEEFHNKTIIDKRDEEAAYLIQEHLRYAETKVMAVVFGKGHTKGIIEYLQTLFSGNFNYYVAR